MPKKTFFNLPNDKREKIIDCAVNEFSNYDYNQASINRIVKDAGIAKGSFYQYFEDKLDLYKYLLNIIGDIKLKYISKHMLNADENDFFDYLKKTFAAGIEFSSKEIKFANIGNRLIKSDENLKNKIYGDINDRGTEYIESLIKKGQLDDNIRKDIDSKFIAYLITYLNFASAEFYFKIYDKFENNGQYVQFSNQIIDMLENGIKK